MIFRKKLSKKAQENMTPAQINYFYETGRVVTGPVTKKERAREYAKWHYWNVIKKRREAILNETEDQTKAGRI